MSDNVDGAMTDDQRRRLQEYLRLNDTGPVVEALIKGTRLRAEDTDLLDRPYRPRVLQLPPHLISNADAELTRLKRQQYRRSRRRMLTAAYTVLSLMGVGIGVLIRVIYEAIF